jgi:hypothetical protein
MFPWLEVVISLAGRQSQTIWYLIGKSYDFFI